VVGIHDQHGVQRFLRKSGIVDLAANNLDVFQPLVLNEAFSTRRASWSRARSLISTAKTRPLDPTSFDRCAVK
jgi:hypothetical protein